jgi:hypothetical protein
LRSLAVLGPMSARFALIEQRGLFREVVLTPNRRHTTVGEQNN